jgi:hypothetical protein
MLPGLFCLKIGRIYLGMVLINLPFYINAVHDRITQIAIVCILNRYEALQLKSFRFMEVYVKKELLKKILKIVGRVVLGILGIFAAFLLFVKIWNEIAMSREKELLESHPGEFVEVDGRNMNIYVEGD